MTVVVGTTAQRRVTFLEHLKTSVAEFLHVDPRVILRVTVRQWAWWW